MADELAGKGYVMSAPQGVDRPVTDEERCPNCKSEDYGDATEFVKVCLACRVYADTGTDGVCPGGKHPLDQRRALRRRPACCDDCYGRVPRDLPEYPKWRSRLRTLNAITWKYPEQYAEADSINARQRPQLRRLPPRPPPPLRRLPRQRRRRRGRCRRRRHPPQPRPPPPAVPPSASTELSC